MICLASWLRTTKPAPKEINITDAATAAFEKTSELFANASSDDAIFFAEVLNDYCLATEERYKNSGIIEPDLYQKGSETQGVLRILANRPAEENYWDYVDDNIPQVFDAQLYEFEDRDTAMETAFNVLSIGIVYNAFGHVPKEIFTNSIQDNSKNDPPEHGLDT